MHSPRNWKCRPSRVKQGRSQRVEESKGAPIGQGASRQRNARRNPRKASNIPKEQNAMKPAADQERAERAIATLKRVQFSPSRRRSPNLRPFPEISHPGPSLATNATMPCRNTEAAGGSRSLPQLPRRRRALGECHGQNGRLAPVAAELIRLAAYCGGASRLQALPKVIGVKRILWWRGCSDLHLRGTMTIERVCRGKDYCHAHDEPMCP